MLETQSREDHAHVLFYKNLVHKNTETNSNYTLTIPIRLVFFRQHILLLCNVACEKTQFFGCQVVC